ncbi:glycosyl transferase [Aureococcus anophagefferens]|nr:glycosyl transferase [Aureococcus anophagefferens]
MMRWFVLAALFHVATPAVEFCRTGLLSSLNDKSRAGRSAIHAVVDPPTAAAARAALACALGAVRVRVYGFDVAAFAGRSSAANLTIRAPENARKGNLAAGPNFARFYLADLLPPGVDKVVYLDADTIVRKDVAHLFDTSLTSSTPRNFAVAAVSRRYKAMCGSFINCRSPEVTMLLKSQKITDPDAQLDPFNAGVLVVHLGRWRALELTRAVEFWMRWNSDLPLYKLGSNPPLVLAVRDRFQHLDNRWNCQRGHTCWDRGDAGALHWSGANKPWGLTFERDRVEWLPFAAPKCLAGLPELGAVYEATSAGDDRRFRPRRRSRNATGFGSRSAGVARRPAEGDRDLLWPAYDLVGAYPPSDAPTFLRDARRAVRAMAESYGDCGAILACVFGRALEVDASNFGKDAPCGVVPPPSLLRSLEFLSALLEAPFSRDVAFPDAACFVIAGEPLRASTVPEALDRVPVLAHAKADDRRGIWCPGRRRSPAIRDAAAAAAPAGAHAQARAGAAPPAAARRAEPRDLDAAAFAAAPPGSEWDARSGRLFWRGKLDPKFNCDDDGTWARLSAVALTLAHPALFDARMTRKARAAREEACLRRARDDASAYARHLRRVVAKRSGTARPRVANLGRPDDDDAALFAAGAAVLRWDADCRSWFHAALANGRTHLAVDVRTAAKVADLLVQNDAAAQFLARGARGLLCRNQIFNPTSM